MVEDDEHKTPSETDLLIEEAVQTEDAATEAVDGTSSGDLHRLRSQIGVFTALGRGACLGRYVVLDALGRGGMGHVYSAYDPELDRKIALKVLRSELLLSENRQRAQARLVREAQAIAKLAHPNVVAVYDVGAVDDRVFVAMELVEGVTLSQWLVEQPRSWREVLRLLEQAGQGLAAAHAVDLVHRDFKPGNVMLGKDGRVRVLDFGLALIGRPGFEELEPAGQEPSASSAATSSSVSDLPEVKSSLSGSGATDRLTVTGRALGTPAYMAPEQYVRRQADARSDQFSFCVTFYQALYGELPFAGHTVAEFQRRAREGRVRDEPAGSPVPGWLRRVLLRGLSPRPEDRYPSVDALLAELKKAPRNRRLWLTAAAVLAVTSLLIFGVTRLEDRGTSLCSGAEQHWQGVWDEPRKNVIADAFEGTGKPYAGASWSMVAQELDRYSADWSHVHIEACTATRLRGEQSEEMLDRRMLCLDHRLQEARALTELFVDADGQTVSEAVTAVQSLPRIAACNDLERLTATVPPPDDPQQRRQLIEARERLAQGKALLETGKYPAGIQIVEELRERAEQVAYPPFSAELLLVLGKLQKDDGQRDAAVATFEEALWAALAADDRSIAVDAAGELAWIVSHGQKQIETAQRWLSLGKSLLIGMGSPPALEAELLGQEAMLQVTAMQPERAIETFEHALELSDRVFGPEHIDRAKLLGYLSTAYYIDGRFPEAISGLEEVRRQLEDGLGVDHPRVATVVSNLGSVLVTAGRPDRAIEPLERALEILRQTVGPRHPVLINTFNSLIVAHHAMAQHRQAWARAQEAWTICEPIPDPEKPPDCIYNLFSLASSRQAVGEGSATEDLWRVVALMERLYGGDHPDMIMPLEALAEIAVDKGRYDEAVAHLQRARHAVSAAFGLEHRDVAKLLCAEGRVERQRGEPRRALELHKACHDLWLRVASTDDPGTAEILAELAETSLSLGQHERAVELAEEALVRRRQTAEHPVLLARYEFLLGRALWARDERARAEELAERARRAYAELGEAPRELADVESWLATLAVGPAGVTK